MLYIETNVDGTVEWHVGEKVPFVIFEFAVNDKVDDSKEIWTIQADGDELNYILQRFENIPQTDAKVQRWNNPWATYIVANLT